jgi:hypothetical protein
VELRIAPAFSRGKQPPALLVLDQGTEGASSWQPLQSMQAGSSSVLVVMLPPGTDRCRLAVRYAPDAEDTEGVLGSVGLSASLGGGLTLRGELMISGRAVPPPAAAASKPTPMTTPRGSGFGGAFNSSSSRLSLGGVGGGGAGSMRAMPGHGPSSARSGGMWGGSARPPLHTGPASTSHVRNGPASSQLPLLPPPPSSAASATQPNLHRSRAPLPLASGNPRSTASGSNSLPRPHITIPRDLSRRTSCETGGTSAVALGIVTTPGPQSWGSTVDPGSPHSVSSNHLAPVALRCSVDDSCGSVGGHSARGVAACEGGHGGEEINSVGAMEESLRQKQECQSVCSGAAKQGDGSHADPGGGGDTVQKDQSTPDVDSVTTTTSTAAATGPDASAVTIITMPPPPPRKPTHVPPLALKSITTTATAVAGGAGATPSSCVAVVVATSSSSVAATTAALPPCAAPPKSARGPFTSTSAAGGSSTARYVGSSSGFAGGVAAGPRSHTAGTAPRRMLALSTSAAPSTTATPAATPRRHTSTHNHSERDGGGGGGGGVTLSTPRTLLATPRGAGFGARGPPSVSGMSTAAAVSTPGGTARSVMSFSTARTSRAAAGGAVRSPSVAVRASRSYLHVHTE